MAEQQVLANALRELLTQQADQRDLFRTHLENADERRQAAEAAQVERQARLDAQQNERATEQTRELKALAAAVSTFGKGKGKGKGKGAAAPNFDGDGFASAAASNEDDEAAAPQQALEWGDCPAPKGQSNRTYEQSPLPEISTRPHTLAN